VLVVLPLAGMLGSLALVVWLVDPAAVASTMASADPAWLAGTVAFCFLCPAIAAAKLRLLLIAVELPVPLRRCVSAVLAAITLNAVVPGRGGDFIRAVFLTDTRATFGVVLGAVLLERIIDIFVLGALAVGLSLILGNAGAPTWLGFGACGAAVAAFLVLAWGHRSPIARETAARVSRAVRSVCRQPRILLATLFFSILTWVDIIAAIVCCFRAVRSVVPLAAILQNTPIAILAGSAPISVSGIGTRDGAMLLLLRSYGSDAEIVAASFLFTAVNFGLLPLVGFMALGRETLRKLRVARREEALQPPP
jgi:uncharacterized membrane protein YbhN (UPF0104 family)